MMKYPRIHLAIDNSFATKRWTTPDEWASIIRDFGIRCIEASADTEADPFYCGVDYLEEWIEQVQEACCSHDVKVVNFYTGYTTYRTLGLAHPDVRIRQRIMNDWLKVMARIAARIQAGLGFYIHAFAERILQDPVAYAEAKDRLYDTLAEVARFAGEAGQVPIIVEQMYTPHQIPWTIKGTLEYISEVSRRSGFPAYVAIDTGHQIGQHRFLRKSNEEIERYLKTGKPAPYLGPESLYGEYEKAYQCGAAEIKQVVKLIGKEMDKYQHLFAQEKDCDLYRWLEEAGCYSPIVHLQQTDGNSSSHLPFIPAYNDTGIVNPPKLLQAIARAYERPTIQGMPPRCEDIYLTFEIFPHTTDSRREILDVLTESTRYWRKWIPEDGINLETLLDRRGC